MLCVLLAIVLGRSAAALLALQQPAVGPRGEGVRTLVVEGWLDGAELLQAVAAARTGRYERVLTTGGEIDEWAEDSPWHDGASRAADYLRRHGLTWIPVIALPTPPTVQDRTYAMAMTVRGWAQASGVALPAIDLFSAGMHVRRSRWVYRMALGDAVEVGTYAARPTLYDPQHWWLSSAGVKATMGETLSLVWTTCCFWPSAPR